MVRVLNRGVVLGLASAALLAAVSGGVRATTLFEDDFSSHSFDTKGWTTQRNFTPVPETGTPGGGSWQLTFSGAGHPFYGEGWDGTNDSYFAATPIGGNQIEDLWLKTPQINFNGQTSTFSFYTFSMGSSTARLQVRLSTGSGTIPDNGGLSSTAAQGLTGGVGDFTKLLLDINPTRASGVYPTFDGSFTPAWTKYTVTIAGNLVPTTGYLAFYNFGQAYNFTDPRIQTDAIDTVSLVTSLAGDANLDGTVDLGDFDAWLANVGSATNLYASGDYDGSGTVDLGDFDVWFKNVGAGAPTVVSATVPEPASVAVLGLAGGLLLSRRRARKA